MAQTEKLRQLQDSSEKKNVSLSYKAFPGWMSLAAFGASLASAALLFFLSFPIQDQKIYPTEYDASPAPSGISVIASELAHAAYWLETRFSPLSDEERYRALVNYPAPRSHRIFFREHRISQPAGAYASYGFYVDASEISEAVSEQEYVGTWSAVLLFSAASFLLALRLRERRLLLNKLRMRFPSAMLLELGGKLERKWNELSAISLNRTDVCQTLLFYFEDGGKATIDLKKLSHHDLETLLNLIDLHAPQVQKAPELILFRQELFSSHNNPCFTQLWEEELQSRFAATNFVALTKGSTLQNGRLKVAMPLASGGLSAVYLLECANKMAVLKESVVPEGSSEESRKKAKELFTREASILISLEHPRIARVLDYFQENNRDYLLIEYIPGVTLREYVRRHGPQSESQVAGWAKSIAEILGYLHSQDPPVIHRDLTPDNLMITPSGEIVLIDFGAANQYLGTATGTIVGKQFYISPEQFRGKATPASDIYSLGGTLFFLLTGNDPEALAVSSPKSQREEVSIAMDGLVSQCTALNEQSRFANVSEVSEALGNLAGGLGKSDKSDKSGAKALGDLKTRELDSGVVLNIAQEEKIPG